MNIFVHITVEVIITIIKLIKGYGRDSFDYMSYKEYKERNQ